MNAVVEELKSRAWDAHAGGDASRSQALHEAALLVEKPHPVASITVYSKPTGCFACINTKRWLKTRGIDFVEEDITTEANLEAARSLGYQEAPVVIATVDGVERHWSGFNPNELETYQKAVSA